MASLYNSTEPSSVHFILLIKFTMPRVLAIDYGKKRIGLAHTDEEKIIASPLDTVLTKEIFNYLNGYFEKYN